MDDMLITTKVINDIAGLKALLRLVFDTKNLGVVKKNLGMEIHKDGGSKKLWLTQ